MQRHANSQIATVKCYSRRAGIDHNGRTRFADSPTRISWEKLGALLADCARRLIRLRALSSANESAPVTMRWRSYINSSPFPLSKMRQSHGMRSPGGCCVRMLVVQLVVTALYQRGLSRRAL